MKRPSFEHLVSTDMTVSLCPSCLAPTRAGLTGGMPVRLELARINRTGELVAALAGLATYQVGVMSTRLAAKRSAAMIAGPWPPYAFVHPAHRCLSRWPAVLTDT